MCAKVGEVTNRTVLGRVERGVYSLAVRLDVKLESAMLLRALVGALKKLKEMGDRAYAVLMEGMRLAWAFSEAAASWGNEAAKAWRSDANYALFLGSLLVRKTGMSDHRLHKPVRFQPPRAQSASS